MKHWISSFVNASQSAAISSGVKGESLPDPSKFSGKGNVSQGVVKFAQGESFTAYAFKSGGTQLLDMHAIYKSEKGAVKTTTPGKNVRPKIKGGSKAIKKGPKTSVSNVAARLSKFSPAGKRTLPKKSVGKTFSSTMLTPGDKVSENATNDVKTMT